MGLRLYPVPEWPRLYRLHRCVAPRMSSHNYSHFIFLFSCQYLFQLRAFQRQKKTSEATLFIEIQSAKIGDQCNFQSLFVGFFLVIGFIQRSILCKIPFPCLSGNSPEIEEAIFASRACSTFRKSVCENTQIWKRSLL